LAKEIADIMKYTYKVYFTGSEYGKNESRFPDSRQFRELFGDYPFTTLNEGLKITVDDFYKVVNKVDNPNYGYTK
jgi:nucleoside-diphosphate-sugar epimerase